MSGITSERSFKKTFSNQAEEAQLKTVGNTARAAGDLQFATFADPGLRATVAHVSADSTSTNTSRDAELPSGTDLSVPDATALCSLGAPRPPGPRQETSDEVNGDPIFHLPTETIRQVQKGRLRTCTYLRIQSLLMSYVDSCTCQLFDWQNCTAKATLKGSAPMWRQQHGASTAEAELW